MYGHNVSILRLRDGNILLSGRLVPHQQQMYVDNLALPCNEDVRVVSEAFSRSGVAASPIHSDVFIDCSKPSVGQVGFRTQHIAAPLVASHPVCAQAGERIYGVWRGFSDRESGGEIIYRYALLPSVNSSEPLESSWHAAGPRELVLLATNHLGSDAYTLLGKPILYFRAS
jgi:hypothetical protein